MAAPFQIGPPRDSPSVQVHLPDSCAPTLAPIPNPLRSRLSGIPCASAAPRSLQPGRANAPGHLGERQSRPGGHSGAHRPGARGPVRGLGAGRTSAGGGRGRPERDCLRSESRAGLEAGGARRSGLPQDQKSDSGSGQMSCCLQRAPPLSTRLYKLTHNWP